jgi:DNA-binding IclR family transcriptional regulator
VANSRENVECDRCGTSRSFAALEAAGSAATILVLQNVYGRSSVYELVNLLIRQGVLEYRGDDGRVFLGRKLYFLGTAYAEQFDLMPEALVV